jgi:hypothetical protein
LIDQLNSPDRQTLFPPYPFEAAGLHSDLLVQRLSALAVRGVFLFNAQRFARATQFLSRLICRIERQSLQPNSVMALSAPNNNPGLLSAIYTESQPHLALQRWANTGSSGFHSYGFGGIIGHAPSPAADIPNARIAGASLTAMSKSERSRVGSVVRPTSIDGDGPAAFILAATQANTITAATFEETRADFEAAWNVLLPTRTEADFRVWRDQRDWTARKYAMRERSEPMKSMMTCLYGQNFDSHRLRENLVHVPYQSPCRQFTRHAGPVSDDVR